MLEECVHSCNRGRSVGETIRMLRHTGHSILGTRSGARLVNCRKVTSGTCFRMLPVLVLGRGASFPFRNHGHHPPGSTIGTVLSFTCALVTGSITTTLRAINLSPCIKFLRALHPKHASLTLSVVRRLHTCLNSHFVLSLVGGERVSMGSFLFRNSGKIIVASGKGGAFVAT